MTGPDPAAPGFAAGIEAWRPPDMHEHDTITAGPAAGFAALLDQPSPVRADGDLLPPLWHWFYFPVHHPQAALGPDGHPRDTGFMPPVDYGRRLFGGGRMWTYGGLRCGDEVQRRTSVAAARTRTGRSGEMLIVTLRSELSVAGELRMAEEREVVYLADPRGARPERSDPNRPVPGQMVPAEPEPTWRLSIPPDPVLLFRFSALTHNTHRIHYDRSYATDVEGQPGLLVHGPLLALLLLELPRRHEVPVTSFDWRVRRPVFDHETIECRGDRSGDSARLSASAGGGGDRVSGQATLAGG
ncbi:MaoC family dehydratase N-terminal domain-containing protein [Polymorphospora sp. NPDC051019]|uniref:FAS1-like dehydratase domain-containing protein n=1 Tax=Polymorphospora sp. NPDC051019 TaxID=3155725 RepID=UPI0034190F39